MMFNGENMSYAIDDLKNVLKKINGDLWSFIYTEHCFEKLQHRLIDMELIENKLLYENPIDIKEISHSPDYFQLTFKSGGGDICVVVHIFNLKSLILISAVFGG